MQTRKMHVKIERSYLPLKLRSIVSNNVTKIKKYQLMKLLKKNG